MNSCTSRHEVLWTYCLGEGLSGILGGAILVKVRCVLFFFFLLFFFLHGRMFMMRGRTGFSICYAVWHSFL